MRARDSIGIVAALIVAAALALHAQEKLAPYVPTPQRVVEKMLQLGAVKPGEKLFDLGSGDGRIVIAAAKKFKADATGVELDDALARSSSAAILKQHLEKSARIIHGDILQQDYSGADVVMVYLFPEANAKIAPILEKQLKKGARVVAHDFEFPDWHPSQTQTIEDGGDGRSHTLFLYLR